jgi:hypothetical protein
LKGNSQKSRTHQQVVVGGRHGPRRPRRRVAQPFVRLAALAIRPRRVRAHGVVVQPEPANLSPGPRRGPARRLALRLLARRQEAAVRRAALGTRVGAVRPFAALRHANLRRAEPRREGQAAASLGFRGGARRGGERGGRGQVREAGAWRRGLGAGEDGRLGAVRDGDDPASVVSGAGLARVRDAAGFDLLVFVEMAPLAAFDGEGVAGEAGFQHRAAAVERDVEFGELAELGALVVAAEEREEVAASGGAAVFWLARGDGDAGPGAVEEEPRSPVAEAAEGGVVGAERAAHDDLRENVRRALAEVPAALPCVVEALHETRLRPLRVRFAPGLQCPIRTTGMSERW